MHHYTLRFRTFALLSLVTSLGCSMSRSTNTARTGMEQLLISNAVDQALDKYEWSNLTGYAVILDDKHLDCIDKGYLLGSIRERIVCSHGRITTKPEEADIVLEVRSGAIGTDTVENYVGMPRIAVPGILPLELPEIKFWNRSSQIGTAKLGLVAYEAKTGRLFAHGGQALARSDDSKWFVFGIGPFENGTVRSEVGQSVDSPMALTRFSPVVEPTLIGSRPNSDETVR